MNDHFGSIYARNSAADRAIVTASALNEQQRTSRANFTLRVRHPRPLARSTSTRRASCVESQASLSSRKSVVGELEGDVGCCLGCKRQHRRIVVRKVIAPKIRPIHAAA